MVEADGNRFFFVDPKNKIPFITIVVNNLYDTLSDLDRDGIFRLNVGISKATFAELFDFDPHADVPEPVYDFTSLDEIMPHPVYGRIYWICVLNPSTEVLEKAKPLLKEAFDIAAAKYERTLRAASPQGEQSPA